MSTCLLHETFAGASIDPRLQWLNRPPTWRVGSGRGTLTIEPSGNTDFWQRTHYGFRVDTGHFLGLPIHGDFSVETEVAWDPAHQYDQAGLMIRVSADCWIKASVEHELEIPPQLGAVVTNSGYSDWSLQDLPLPGREIRFRMLNKGGDISVAFGPSGDTTWTAMRLAHLHVPQTAPLWCGLYACSPKGAGFRAEFHYLRIESL